MKRSILVGAASALALAVAAGPAMAETKLKLGALVPLTGDLQAYGETSFNGIKLAAEHINQSGGVLGGELDIAVGDTQTTAQSGVDAAQKLVNVEQVSGIIGALSSGVTIPVATSVTSGAGVPQISGASTSPVMTGLEDGDFLFRTVPSDALQGTALAEIVSEEGYKTVSVIYVNNDYGKGLDETFSRSFEGMGGTVATSVAYEKGQSSYRGELSRAAKGSPEALVMIGYPENGTTILRQALEGGYFSKFVFSDGMKAPEIIASIGAEYLEGSIGTAPSALQDSPELEAFRKGYEAEYGEVPPKPYIDSAYDATMLLALAAQKAGSSDPTALRDALRFVANAPGEKVGPGEWAKAVALLADGQDINYEGAAGPVDFDDAGDVVGAFEEWTIDDGKIVTRRVFAPSM